VLFLSGLQGIPGELEDAARVDGCTALQRLRHVVIPLLARTTVFMLIVLAVSLVQMRLLRARWSY
jgi:ABC-type sugar transport system permease subunit